MLVEAADHDEDNKILQIDPVRAVRIRNESEKFANNLVDDGWLERATVALSTSLTHAGEN